MLPTRLQVKQRFYSLLDDPTGQVFNDNPGPGTPPAPSLFQNAFSEAYDVLFNAFLNQQVSAVENVIQGIIVPPSPIAFSLTPAQMGITDFADWEWIRERAAGSSDIFLDIWDEDNLTQRAPTDRLLETVWQNNAFQFVGCTTVRELQLKYVASGEAPTADSTQIGIDSSLMFLSNYSAGTVGGNKGYEAMATKCMNFAVGPKFALGSIGGELFRLIQPLVRARQKVQIASRPFTSRRRALFGRGAIPYIAAQITSGTFPGATVEFSTQAGTITGVIDGVNATFWLQVPVQSFDLYWNGLKQTENVNYTALNNQFTFLANSIPQPGDGLTAVGIPLYQQ